MKALITLHFIFSVASLDLHVQAQDSRGSSSSTSSIANLQKLQQENAESYGEEFLELEKNFLQSKNHTQLIELYQLHIDYLNKLDSYDSIISVLHRIRGLLNSKSPKQSLQVYLALGSNFYFKGNYDSLVYWQRQAEEIVDPTSPLYGEYLLLSGLRRYKEQLYEESISCELKAVDIFEANQNYKYLAIVYNNLASNYLSLGNVDAQQEFLIKAISINKRLGDSYHLVMNYNNLGASYRNQNKLDEALAVYDSAFVQLESLNFPMLLAQNLTNRGNILEKLEDFQGAESLFLECEQICIANGIAYGVMLSQVNLGNLYRQMKRFDQAKVRLEKALALSVELSAFREKALIYERLAWLARDKQDFGQAYQFITQFHTLNDSLLSESVKKNADELKEKYESEKKELEIISLSNDKLNQQYLIALLGIGVLVLMIALQWWRNKLSLAKVNLSVSEKLNKSKSEALRIREQDLLQQTMEKVALREQMNELIDRIKNENTEGKNSNKIKSIELSQKPWEEMVEKFKLLHPNFIDSLKSAFPDLNTNDIALCSLIKMNLSTKEIAKILRITDQSVHTRKYRLSKKLALTGETDLASWVHSQYNMEMADKN